MAYLDRERLSVAGVATTTGTGNDPDLVASCAAYGQVFQGAGAVRGLAAASDALIAWGISDMASLIAGFSGPVILVGHGSCEGTRALLGMAMPGATHLVAVSRASAVAFPAALLAGRTVTVLYNGADPKRCAATVTRAEMRRGWGISDSEVAIGHVGRLSPEKNPLAAARAAVVLGRPFRAVYAGDARWHSDIPREIRRRCPDAVILGPVTQVGNVLNALDCFILASPYEGFSLALTEAWLCGVPTVTTPVGAVEELEAEHGPLTVRVRVDPPDEDLAAGVRQAITTENRQIVERAAALTALRFTAQAMARRWTDYLLATIGP